MVGAGLVGLAVVAFLAFGVFGVQTLFVDETTGATRPVG